MHQPAAMSDLLDDRAGLEEVTEKERPAGSEDEDEDEDEDFEDGDETKEGASGQDSSEEEEVRPLVAGGLV